MNTAPGNGKRMLLLLFLTAALSYTSTAQSPWLNLASPSFIRYKFELKE